MLTCKALNTEKYRHYINIYYYYFIIVYLKRSISDWLYPSLRSVLRICSDLLALITQGNDFLILLKLRYHPLKFISEKFINIWHIEWYGKEWWILKQREFVVVVAFISLLYYENTLIFPSFNYLIYFSIRDANSASFKEGEANLLCSEGETIFSFPSWEVTLTTLLDVN